MNSTASSVIVLLWFPSAIPFHAKVTRPFSSVRSRGWKWLPVAHSAPWTTSRKRSWTTVADHGRTEELRNEPESRLDQGAEIFHEQHQVHGIEGRDLEIEMQIKPFGTFVDRIDEQGADSDGVGGLGDSHQRVEQ